jgi:ubiquinone/menaquinone biosynthesis C-methylase UbiE
MLDHARTHNPGEYLRIDVRKLGFERDSFDGVWCPATVFFEPESEIVTALAEFARVLRPGSRASGSSSAMAESKSRSGVRPRWSITSRRSERGSCWRPRGSASNRCR